VTVDRNGWGAVAVNASAIARLLDAELEGGADPEITGAAPLDRAGPTDFSIVAKARYLPYVPASRAGLLLVAAELATGWKIPDRPRSCWTRSTAR
jgi:UDP-3-O-[3-hydroxymyristoyl] glucosamine N-acyltransferase